VCLDEPHVLAINMCAAGARSLQGYIPLHIYARTYTHAHKNKLFNIHTLTHKNTHIQAYIHAPSHLIHTHILHTHNHTRTHILSHMNGLHVTHTQTHTHTHTHTHDTADGETTKLLLELQDGMQMEAVIMHYDTTGTCLRVHAQHHAQTCLRMCA
jgi:hypothetical protein